MHWTDGKKSVHIHYILMLEYSYSGNIQYRVDTQLYTCHGAVMVVIKRIIQVKNWLKFLCAYVVCNLGKPFIHPDGSSVVYGPATVAPAAARNLQQGKTPQQPIPALTQQQPSNHFHSQVSPLALHHKLLNCRNLQC